MSHVKIVLPSNDPNHANSVIEIDGHDITSQVRGFALKAEVGHLNTITLDLCVFQYEHEGETRVHIADGVAETLTRLGWLPPGCTCITVDVRTHGDKESKPYRRPDPKCHIHGKADL